MPPRRPPKRNQLCSTVRYVFRAVSDYCKSATLRTNCRIFTWQHVAGHVTTNWFERTHCTRRCSRASIGNRPRGADHQARMIANSQGSQRFIGGSARCQATHNIIAARSLAQRSGPSRQTRLDEHDRVVTPFDARIETADLISPARGNSSRCRPSSSRDRSRNRRHRRPAYSSR
jgi:hypothetical protein